MQKEPKECKTLWPICIETMEKSEKHREKSLFVYRVNNITDHIIANYYNTNEKESPHKTKHITKYNSSGITSSNYKINSTSYGTSFSNNNTGIIAAANKTLSLNLSNSINNGNKL